MNPTIKLFIALLGIVMGAIQPPLWLTLFMLVLITSLLTEGCLKTAILVKKKQTRAKRLDSFYERKCKRCEWVSQKPDLPMLEFKNYPWW